MHASEGVFSFDSEHSCVVSLFTQLHGSDVLKRQALKTIQALLKTKLGGREKDAVILLREAFFNEENKVLRKEMERLLKSRKAQEVWEAIAQ